MVDSERNRIIRELQRVGQLIRTVQHNFCDRKTLI